MRTSRTRRSAATVATAMSSFLLLTAAAVATAPAATAGTPGGTRADDRNCDFDGDGFEDLLIGAPGASVAGSEGAGMVSVQYGSRHGLDTRHAQVLTRNSPGIKGSPGRQDRFGAAVASGDLDSDGYDDAIIGAPGADHGAVADAGGVLVLWGSPNGLASRDTVWLDPSTPTPDGHFGTSLAAARLSAATPGDVLAVLDRQDVSLLTFPVRGGDTGGDPGGLAPEDRGRWTVQRLNLGAGAGYGTRGGARAGGARAEGRVALAPVSLTVGDYDASGFSDLVVSGVTTGTGTRAGTEAGTRARTGTGTRARTGTGTRASAGAGGRPGRGWSAYLAGSAAGPVWARDLRGGPVAASGDINGDGYDDLVTGEPDPVDDDLGAPTGGVVTVHYGGPAGPGPDTPVQYWTQDSPGIPGAAEPGDAWGGDLSVGDTDADGYADVAVGAPGEDSAAPDGATVRDAGSLTVLHGTADGLTGRGARSWSQSTAHIPGTMANGDRWGAQVRLIDPDGDRHFDLIAGAPGEHAGAGAVWLLPATSTGITATGSWTYGLRSLGATGATGATYRGAEYGAAVDE